MKTVCTNCYITLFVCRYDQLDEAKQRHQRCVDGIRDHYNVHFSSEQAYDIGEAVPMFQLLIEEIFGWRAEIPPEVREQYSTFAFTTVVDVVHDSDSEVNEYQTVANLLEIDFEWGFPAKFPSRTRALRVSAGGHEIEGCNYY